MLSRDTVRRAPGQVVLTDGAVPPSTLVLTRAWHGSLCRSRLVNRGAQTVRIRQVILFSIAHALPGDTGLYGEGFQMLTQTGGTLAHPIDLGDYTDPGHYRLLPPAGARTVYGLLTLAPPQANQIQMAFTQCRRFSGRFDLYAGRIDVVVDTEGLELSPGETWELEEFQFLAGGARAEMLDALAKHICRNHPPLKTGTTGKIVGNTKFAFIEDSR